MTRAWQENDRATQWRLMDDGIELAFVYLINNQYCACERYFPTLERAMAFAEQYLIELGELEAKRGATE